MFARWLIVYTASGVIYFEKPIIERDTYASTDYDISRYYLCTRLEIEQLDPIMEHRKHLVRRYVALMEPHSLWLVGWGRGGGGRG